MSYPVHSAIEVIEGNDIYKNEEWWKAALVYERYGRKIGIYLWHKENGDWKRKQKYVVRDVEDWVNDRAAIEGLLPHLDGDADHKSGSPEQDSKVDDLVDEALESST